MSSKALSFKRIFEHDSTPPSLPSSPPHKKSVPAFQSPDHEHLREALQSGVLTLINETIQFFPIWNCLLSDILKDPQHHAFCLDPELSQADMLSIEASLKKMIGVGDFKTAHPGWLTLFSAHPTILETELGFHLQQNVAVKHPFYKIYPQGSNSSSMPSNFAIGQYIINDEMAKFFREANVLYWARSLLQFAYDFIDHSISCSTEPPPFDIPHLCFVNAGLAALYAQPLPTTSHQKSKVNIPRSGYLVEELISGKFLKYIHNMDCQLLYIKTSGLAFISDYQGVHILFLNNQFINEFTVNGGKDMFWNGNIEVGVSKFEKDHICNKYC
ncbi:uncharacterized protein EDB93DRAFT_1083073 [Suillus bovinus]|uniref:uncharacterized protein n=1 Tax=Suillus bovinus TaxID=48563 RepID=UPI001B8842E5|nr:uncharacterized protein EDB93DRAFT_1083073 [Suillus bovinus]KAG2151647.1 hypothetical protein EDB93DRAFT_1083073 [Suillus bovinus]